MYLNILSDKQKQLLTNFIVKFKYEFVLVGGTAIALQIGHRKSIDFDLFTKTPLNKNKIKTQVNSLSVPKQLIMEDYDGVHYIIDSVKVTFFYYPFSIEGSVWLDKTMRMPDLLTLAAMKFYAMGRRAKWKDYVDIYFLLQEYFRIEEVSEKAKELYEDGYSEKLFRQQITYFKDIDDSEPIEWINTPVETEEIKERLIQFATDF